MYACLCWKIRESDVRRAGRNGVTAPDDLITLFSLDEPSCCGGCRRGIQRFVSLAAEGAAGAGTGIVPMRARPSVAGMLAGATRGFRHATLHPSPLTVGLRPGEG